MSEFLEVSDAIARRLCRDALWDGPRCNWLGWAMEPMGGTWTHTYRAQGPDLYAGTAGIALFLARLHPWTRDPIARDTLLGALRQARQAVERIPAESAHSFYSGPAGVGYACLEAGLALEDDSLVREGLRILTGVAALPPDPRHLDVVAGSAGLIPVLLDAARRFGRRDLVESARAHGRLLVSTAVRSTAGWSWKTLEQVPRHLLGFGHGASGIAWALLELFEATGETAFRDAALEGLRYERAHSRPDGTWPDLRHDSGSAPPPRSMDAWCHGAPGIGLARLRALAVLGSEPALTAELGVALRATAASLTSEEGLAGFSLCHGAGGNADLLLLAAEALGQPHLRWVAEAAGWRGVERYHRTGLPWPCGVSGAGETPNLMLGLAGIGHFYLRLYSKSVSSVLLIDTRGAAPAGEMEEDEEEILAAVAAG